MRLVTLLFVILACSVLSAEAWLFKDSQYAKLFTTFLTKFKKAYSVSKFASRLMQFKKNLDRITSVNSLKRRFKLGVNEYSDLTAAEFSKRLGARFPTDEASSFVEAEAYKEMSAEQLDAAFTSGFDWSTKNVLLDPRHQGSCGSCYAFAAVSTIEAAVAIAGGNKEYISVQRFICAKTHSCMGCAGGWSTCVFKHAQKTGYFIDAAAPYLNKDDVCGGASDLAPLGKIHGYKSIRGNSAAYIQALNINPLWVTVNASPLQLYKSGIVDSNCSTVVNHAVVLMGYGTDSGTAYYKIRNSWGKDWGENGNFRIASSGNMCGIHSRGGSYPVLTKK